MILGSLKVDASGQAVHTHRDTYLIASVSVISVRRPFLPLAVTMALGLAGFGLAFHELLWTWEKVAIAGLCLLALTAGWHIGLLQFLSRDLRGSDLMAAVFGSYGHLNALRAEISAAKRQAIIDKMKLNLEPVSSQEASS